MKERPILFSAPMVRAILEGRKTQTRRVVKAPRWSSQEEIDLWVDEPFVPDDNDTSFWIECPYGKAGGKVWVRENCWLYGKWTKNGKTKTGKQRYKFKTIGQQVRYDNPVGEKMAYFGGDEGFTFRPSIFMPRWASRIDLEITGVRVERLNDISQSDAIAEGAPPSHPSIDSVSREFGYSDFSRSWFAQLWEHINGAGSWQKNPWVWVVEFKRVKP